MAGKMAALPMVELWRGGRMESVHAGHAVICDAAGQIVEAWGDPEAVIFPRSSCKMLQALPLVESGAADAAGLSEAQLALACASHQGAAIHTGMVSRWLADLGMAEADLRCGAHEPYDRAERDRLILAHETPCQIHNNCSGKHAGFLTMTRHLKAGPEYVEPGPSPSAGSEGGLRGRDRRDLARLWHRRLLGARTLPPRSTGWPGRWRVLRRRAGRGMHATERCFGWRGRWQHIRTSWRARAAPARS